MTVWGDPRDVRGVARASRPCTLVPKGRRVLAEVLLVPFSLPIGSYMPLLPFPLLTFASSTILPGLFHVLVLGFGL